jgi:hypothetical protein
MGSSDSPLTPLERAFLERLFASVRGVRLSGGGALAVHVGHRRSLDVGLFVQEESAFRALHTPVASRGGRSLVEPARTGGTRGVTLELAGRVAVTTGRRTRGR